jgi:hypothetical protein
MRLAPYPVDDIGDVWSGDPKQFSNIPITDTGGSQTPNFCNLFVGELSNLQPASLKSAMIFGISHVLGASANSKMFRSHTVAYSTQMANFQSNRNRAVDVLIYNPMNVEVRPPVLRHRVADYAIAMSVMGSGVKPTSVSLSDTAHKTFDGRCPRHV